MPLSLIAFYASLAVIVCMVIYIITLLIKNSKAILQSKFGKLNPGDIYTIKYRNFLVTNTFEFTVPDITVTTLVDNYFYSGRRDMHITVSAKNINILVINLRSVIDVKVKECEND